MLKGVSKPGPPIPMKITHWPLLGVATLLSAGFCPMANANLFSDNFETLVVAETAKDAPAPAAPFTYSAMDGGYIEAGNPLWATHRRPPTGFVRPCMTH
jgi:hypothetical protein